MMREYQTNKLHLKFDYETIERDFDIYQIKQKAEEKFDEFLWSGLVYEIVVYTKQDVRFFLKNGLEIDTGL